MRKAFVCTRWQHLVLSTKHVYLLPIKGLSQTENGVVQPHIKTSVEKINLLCTCSINLGIPISLLSHYSLHFFTDMFLIVFLGCLGAVTNPLTIEMLTRLE